MTTLNRVIVSWGGSAVVGSAVNVLHYSASDNAAPPVAAILSAYSLLNQILPNGTTISVANTGDQIDDTTGHLSGSWNGTGGGSFQGNYDPIAAAGVGACVTWSTGGIVTGAKGVPHRLRGRTFLVPLAGTRFQADGTLSQTQLTALNDWAAAMMASGPLAVWHRPTTKGGTNGNSYGVQSYRVRDKVAFLSSRRD